MRIAGWKTSNVFKRYAIVDRADIRAALQQLERARRNQSDPTGEPRPEPGYTSLSQLPIAVC
jgi:hypothetical protein